MTRVENESLEAAESALKEAGFAVSQFCSSRPSCFDFAARKTGVTILVKFHSDISGFSSSDSRELRVISECMSAVSLLIGKESRGKQLEDDTVYTRYDILTVTPRTFESIVTRNAHPLIHAGPGGYCVEIDGETLKNRRQKLGLSTGQVAEMIGISRRTLYGYERGMARASVAAAYNLVYTLGVPVAKPIDIFEKSKKQRSCFLTRAGPAMAVNKLLQRILKKFAPRNFTAVKKAPFDFVIIMPEEKMRILGGVASDKERELDRRVEEILSVSRVVHAHPVLIVEGRKPSNKNIGCIRGDELSRIRTPEDLIVDY
jgi:putative transcriptional regulator